MKNRKNLVTCGRMSFEESKNLENPEICVGTFVNTVCRIKCKNEFIEEHPKIFPKCVVTENSTGKWINVPKCENIQFDISMLKLNFPRYNLCPDSF
ncbi:hypothetical protein MHBO_000584 [Bonamia ostreae]|uniref:Uncharacterized protein n=1 Tax=Bonamia ostreae TaxID=126728 RepID=A0ABV2AG31_9EUKA